MKVLFNLIDGRHFSLDMPVSISQLDYPRVAPVILNCRSVQEICTILMSYDRMFIQISNGMHTHTVRPSAIIEVAREELQTEKSRS